MPIILTKSLRDMAQRWRATLLAIFALTIGLWGVGTLLTSVYILTNDLNQNFKNTNPAHININSSDFNKLNLDELRALPTIEAAEFRDQSLLRVEIRPNEWLPMMLYGVEDFAQMSLAKFSAYAGNFPPQNGTLAIERNGSALIKQNDISLSELNVGGVARIQSKGKILTSNISSVIFDPGQAPSTQDAIIYAYTDMQNYKHLAKKPSHQRLIIRFNDVETKQDVETQYKQLTAIFATQNIEIDGYNIPQFGEHPHQFQLNTILYINVMIGFLSFIISMVLISQLMNSVFTQEIRQIGIMKAVGGTRGHIFKSYAFYILLISLASIVIGVPLAIATGKAFSSFIAGIINFDILTTTLPHYIMDILIMLGLIMPFIFSLSALRRGLHISVKDALGDYGIDVVSPQKQSSFGGFGSSTLSLSIRNVLRRKTRMIITMATMALGVAIFLTGFNARTSLKEFLDNNVAAMQFDIRVVLSNKTDRVAAMAPFAEIDAIKNIDTWVGERSKISRADGTKTASMLLVASPFDNLLNEHDIIGGTWLTGSSEFEFVANQQAALELKPAIVGDRYLINVNGQKIEAKLVGIVREFDEKKIYVDLTQYNAIANPSGDINILMMSLNSRDYDYVVATKKQVEAVIEANEIDVMFTVSQIEWTKILFDHLNIILMVILFLSLLVLSVSSLGMASAMSINVMERTREIGVLRAIGATPKQVIRLFVTEGFIVSALSVLVGLIIAQPLSSMASTFFGELILGENTPLEYVFSQQGFAITLLVTLTFGYMASRIPAGKATKTSVRDAIAYE